MSRGTAWLACLLAGEALAAAYAVRVDKDVAAVMRDGVKLKADVYRPDAPGPFPVLLARTPYGKQNLKSESMVERGYIVVVQDVRGRGASEGEFDPFFAEEKDGYDSVEWAAALAGSNGKVGMFGSSYSGGAQLAAAAAHPPHLAAITPVFPAIDFGERQILFDGGAFRQLLAESWALAQAVDVFGRNFRALAADSAAFARIGSKLPLGDFMEHVFRDSLARGGGGYFREWTRHDPGSAYWERLNLEKRVADIRVPGCYVAGWYDIFGPATAKLFGAVQRSAGAEARARSRLVVGPWQHGGPKAPAGNADFGPDAAMSLSREQMACFDYLLKNERNEVARRAPAHVFVMGENRWASAPAWPWEGSREYRLYLASSRKLSRTPEKGEQRLVADPANPLATKGGRLCCHPGFPAGSFDTPSHPDVLTYDSPPLESDLRAVGAVFLHLSLSSDAPDGDIVGRLMDVAPDGKPLLVADGALRLRYRGGRAAPQPLAPGKVYRVRVDLGPAAARFGAGHRIRLQIGGSDFPNYSVNLNSGEDLERGANPRKAVMTIRHASSYLELRVYGEEP